MAKVTDNHELITQVCGSRRAFCLIFPTLPTVLAIFLGIVKLIWGQVRPTLRVRDYTGQADQEAGPLVALTEVGLPHTPLPLRSSEHRKEHQERKSKTSANCAPCLTVVVNPGCTLQLSRSFQKY